MTDGESLTGLVNSSRMTRQPQLQYFKAKVLQTIFPGRQVPVLCGNDHLKAAWWHRGIPPSRQLAGKFTVENTQSAEHFLFLQPWFLTKIYSNGCNRSLDAPIFSSTVPTEMTHQCFGYTCRQGLSMPTCLARIWHPRFITGHTCSAWQKWWCWWRGGGVKYSVCAVSYTHLTLPTRRTV